MARGTAEFPFELLLVFPLLALSHPGVAYLHLRFAHSLVQNTRGVLGGPRFGQILFTLFKQVQNSPNKP